MTPDSLRVVCSGRHEPGIGDPIIQANGSNIIASRHVPDFGSHAPIPAIPEGPREPEWLSEWVRNYS